MIAPSLMLTIAGLGALAGAMRRHAAQIGLPPASSPLLRLVGCLLLTASLIALLDRMSWRMATIAWIGQGGMAAALCVVALAVKPRALPVLCLLAGAVGLAILACHS